MNRIKLTGGTDEAGGGEDGGEREGKAHFNWAVRLDEERLRGNERRRGM